MRHPAGHSAWRNPCSEKSMRRSLGPIATLAAALILGACAGERDTPASRLSAPTGALAVGNPNACDFNTMTRDSKTAFSNTDPIVSLIGDMQDAYNARTGGGATGATSKGLDVLAYIAQKRLTAAQHGTNAQVALVVNDVLNANCTVLRSGLPAATATELDSVDAQGSGVEKSLAAGIFAVRGGVAAPAAVALVANPLGGRQQASPVWGVEPQAGCSSVDPLVCAAWPSGTTTDPRYLIFAYPATANLGNENAADQASFNGLNGFLIGMIPDIANKSVFTVGECIDATASDAANLLYHATTTPEIVGNRSPTFCVTGYPSQAMLTTRTWFASLGHRAASWLAPKPLFAKEEFDKFSGGGPSGWSPISFAKITGTHTALAIGKPPKTGVVLVDFYLTVRATSTQSGLPLPDVTIDITLANNSGIPAGAKLTHPAFGVTGPDGFVTIGVAVDKPGGYTFVANGALIGGASTNTAITTAVTNVKSK